MLDGLECVTNLTPAANSYAGVAALLRADAASATRGWLPAPANEPQVAPLTLGAGQFPTVGRAALFETFRASRGTDPVERPLREVFGRIARSRDKMQALLDRPPKDGCDIFVGFSVAGGTGAGIFWDFLRLITLTAQESLGGADAQGDVRIYPLVVLPSAFDSNRGGGRAADLNGGPALRDLFALVNDFNSGNPNPEVIYPGEMPIRVGGTVPVQTAFLFRRPEAITMADLHRSIVAFILSLIGTQVQGEVTTREGSFASWFVNQAGSRNAIAPDGIGLRPASTALAAQLTIPTTDISEILAARLLAEGTRELQQPGLNENNKKEIEKFIAAAGLTPLQTMAFDDPLPAVPYDVKGAQGVYAALAELREAAIQQQRQLRMSLNARVATLANDFDWGNAIRDATVRNDIFHVRRLALGIAHHAEGNTEGGFTGFLQRRAVPPPPERPDFRADPPVTPAMTNRVLGLAKVKFNDEEPREALDRLRVWYDWRTKFEWQDAWGRNSQTWRAKEQRLRKRLDDVIGHFDAHAHAEAESFQRNCQDLYRPRTGVVYFLPDPGEANDLDSFYRTAVLPRLRERLNLPEGAEAGQILSVMMQDKWRAAYETTANADSEEMKRFVMEEVQERMYSVLGGVVGEAESSILPKLRQLLKAIATGEDQRAFPSGLVERFRAALAALLPQGVQPGGPGPLKVQVFYPSDKPDPAIEEYLKEQLFPGGGTQLYHAVADANFLGVVMTRTELPATGISDFRQLMQTWGDALDEAKQDDKLAWRQRLGYDSRWVALTPADRVRVMMAFLNALWDGSVSVVEGPEDSPEKIRIAQRGAPDVPPIELKLTRYLRLSRWSSLLRAYERYALSADEAASMRCAQLIKRGAPSGVMDDPGEPSPLYECFLDLVPQQGKLAKELYNQVPEGARGYAMQAVEFWNETVPAALGLNFESPGVYGANHVELYASIVRERHE